MNTLLSVGGLLILVTVLDCCGASVLQFEPEPDFDVWAKGHGKSYGSIKEYYKRRDIFRDSVKLVQAHNSNEMSSYKLGVNQFADLTYEEFTQQYLLTAKQNCSATHKRKVNIGLGKGGRLPRSVDWRTKGVVSPVKNQGKCGSCWTFSTTGAMEAHMAIDTGAKLNLSEQQLVDCAQAFDNHGCSGGLPSQAFEYIHYNPGLMTEKDYPYTAKLKHIRNLLLALPTSRWEVQVPGNKAVAFVKAIVNITENDEAGLQAAVAMYGPVSIAYQVASDFRLYKSGVYKSKVCQSDPQHVNHAVLVVGYDVTPEGEPYWIVKNSWGTKFGMEGYFWIYRGSNMCGLSDCASFPHTSKHPAKTYH